MRIVLVICLMRINLNLKNILNILLMNIRHRFMELIYKIWTNIDQSYSYTYLSIL